MAHGISRSFGSPGKDATSPIDDGSVVQRAQERLRASPFLALRGLCCVYSAGILIFSGRVPTFHARQLAIAELRRTPGVTEVCDRIRVEFPP